MHKSWIIYWHRCLRILSKAKAHCQNSSQKLFAWSKKPPWISTLLLFLMIKGQADSHQNKPLNIDPNADNSDEFNPIQANIWGIFRQSQANPSPSTSQTQAPNKSEFEFDFTNFFENTFMSFTPHQIAKRFRKYCSAFDFIDIQELDRESTESIKDEVVVRLPLDISDFEMRNIVKLLNHIPRSPNEKLTVLFKVIQSRNDYKKVYNETGINFLLKEGKFDVISIRQKALNEIMTFNRIKINDFEHQIIKYFKEVQTINSKQELEAIAKDLRSDEIIFGLCDASDHNNRAKFNEFIFKNDELELAPITPVVLQDPRFIEECSPNSMFGLIKVRDNQSNFKIVDRPLKLLMLSDIDQIPVDQLATKFGRLIDRSRVFRNRVLGNPPHKYRIDFNMDKNLTKKSDLVEIESMVSQVKDNLDNLNFTFEFNLNFTDANESDQAKFSIIGRNMPEFLKQRYFFLHNTNRFLMDKFLLEDSDHAHLINKMFEFPFQKLNYENMMAFCDHVIEGKFKWYNRSQRLFSFNKYSQRITANDFYFRVVRPSKHAAVLFYHKKCKKSMEVLKMYEQIVHTCLSTGKCPIVYGRMNNTANKSPQYDYYEETPTLMMFRKDLRQQPYAMTKVPLNEKAITDFVEVTSSFELIKDATQLVQLSNAASEIISDLKRGPVAEDVPYLFF